MPTTECQLYIITVITRLSVVRTKYSLQFSNKIKDCTSFSKMNRRVGNLLSYNNKIIIQVLNVVHNARIKFHFFCTNYNN